MQSKIHKLGFLDLLEHFRVGEGFVVNISTYHRSQKSRRNREIFKNVTYLTISASPIRCIVQVTHTKTFCIPKIRQPTKPHVSFYF